MNGWSEERHTSCPGHPEATRSYCRWTDKEDYDLLDAWTAGVPADDIVARHKRTPGGIDSRLRERAEWVSSRRWVWSLPRCWEGAVRYMETMK